MRLPTGVHRGDWEQSAPAWAPLGLAALLSSSVCLAGAQLQLPDR